MALANYMGPVGLLGVGPMKGLDITGGGLAPAKPTTKKKSSGTTTSDDPDYKGYAGDAQHQANMDNMFNAEYKKLSGKFGNDALWVHSTPEYKKLVNTFQSNSVHNARAAVNNEKEGSAYNTLLTSKDGSHSPADLTMEWSEQTQDWRPYMDNRDGFQTKQQRLENIRNQPNIDQNGRINAAYMDKQGGSMEMFNNEITTLYGKANENLRTEKNKRKKTGSSGDASQGMDIAFKNTVDHTWKRGSNFNQLRAAAEYINGNLSKEGQYALAQQDFQGMLKGYGYLPSGIYDEKTGELNFDGQLKTGKDGKIKFDKVKMNPELLNNDDFVSAVRHYSPIRHVQDAKPIFNKTTTHDSYITEEDVDYGDGYGADGKPTMDIGIATAAEAGMYPDAAGKKMQVYETKNGKNVRHQGIFEERNINNAPYEMPVIADAMRGKPLGDLLGSNRSILVGNKWNKIDDLENVDHMLNNMRVTNVLGLGEYLDPNASNPNKAQMGVRLQVAVDEDWLDEYNMQVVDAEGQNKNLGETTLGFYNSVDDDIAKLVGYRHLDDMEDLGLTKADGTALTEAEMNQLNTGDTSWTMGSGRSGDVIEIVVPYDNLTEIDKITFSTRQREKLQTALAGLQAGNKNNRLREQRNQGSQSINVLNQVNQGVGPGNYSVDVR